MHPAANATHSQLAPGPEGGRKQGGEGASSDPPAAPDMGAPMSATAALSASAPRSPGWICIAVPRGEGPSGDTAGAAARGGSASAATEMRPVEVRRRARRAATGDGGGARPGVSPHPFGACPSGSAAAPASPTYSGKPKRSHTCGPDSEAQMNQCLTPPAAEFSLWGLRGQSRVTAAAKFALRGERVQWHQYAGAGAMKRVSQCE